MSVSLLYWGVRDRTQRSGVSPLRGEASPPRAAGKALPHAAQHAVGRLRHKCTLWARVQPVARQDLVLLRSGNGFQDYWAYLQNEGKGSE